MCPLGRPKSIKWSLKSKSNPKWDKYGFSTVGMMFQLAPEAIKHKRKMRKKYGDVPKDLLYSANKVL